MMRRIDLFCKLAGPLFVSLLTIKSSSFAAVFLAASNVASLPFEYLFIRFVYKRFPDLAVKPQRPSLPLAERFLTKVIDFPRRTISSWKIYYRSPLFLASFALCTLYFTVLSFGGIPLVRRANCRFNDRVPVPVLGLLDSPDCWSACNCRHRWISGYVCCSTSHTCHRSCSGRIMVVVVANCDPRSGCSRSFHPR
jgi:hypothetical protein